MCLELAIYQLHPFRAAPSSSVGSDKWREEQVCAENVELSSRDGALLHEVRTAALGKSRVWSFVETSQLPPATRCGAACGASRASRLHLVPCA